MGKAGWLLVALFALPVGHVTWRVYGPNPVPTYWVGGAPTLAGIESKAPCLYLRHEFYCPVRPRHAWLEVAGRDRIRAYANGLVVAECAQEGFTCGAVVDLASHLRQGRNVLAVAATQASMARPPRVVVDGGWSAGAIVGSFRDARWRCAHRPERSAGYWFTPEFHDEHWALARIESSAIYAKLSHSPVPFRTAAGRCWLAPTLSRDGKGAVRGHLKLPDRPRQGWLRVTATACYHLAVNGEVIAEQDEGLGTGRTVMPVERVYDITPLLSSGENTIGLLVTGAPSRQVRLRIEGGALDSSGTWVRCQGSSDWRCQPSVPGGWSQSPQDQPDPTWQRTEVEEGDLFAPGAVERVATPVAISPALQGRRVLGEGLVFIAIAAGIGGASACMNWLIRRCWGAQASAAGVLLVPAVLVGLGILATFDPRVPADWIYQPAVLAASVATVIVQWIILFARRRVARPGGRI